MQGNADLRGRSRSLVETVRQARAQMLEFQANLPERTRRLLASGALACLVAAFGLAVWFIAANDYFGEDLGLFVGVVCIPLLVLALLLLGWRPRIVSLGVTVVAGYLCWQALLNTENQFISGNWFAPRYDGARVGTVLVVLFLIFCAGMLYCGYEIARPGAATKALREALAHAAMIMRGAVALPVVAVGFAVTLFTQDLWLAMDRVDTRTMHALLLLAVLSSAMVMGSHGTRPVWRRLVLAVVVAAAGYVLFLVAARLLIAHEVAEEWLRIEFLAFESINGVFYDEDAVNRYLTVVSRIAELFAAVAVIAAGASTGSGRTDEMRSVHA